MFKLKVQELLNSEQFFIKKFNKIKNSLAILECLNLRCKKINKIKTKNIYLNSLSFPQKIAGIFLKLSLTSLKTSSSRWRWRIRCFCFRYLSVCRCVWSLVDELLIVPAAVCFIGLFCSVVLICVCVCARARFFLFFFCSFVCLFVCFFFFLVVVFDELVKFESAGSVSFVAIFFVFFSFLKFLLA